MNSLPNDLHIAQNLFEQQLAQQILISEKKRVTILAVILSFLALEVFIQGCCTLGFFPKEFYHFGYGLPFWVWLNLLLASFAAYEWGLLFFLDYVIRRKKQFPTFYRYFNVFEETSFPTLAILRVAQVLDPISALMAPPTFIYFIFIILSALRLDFKLCLFTGSVAALEYFSVAWFYLSQLSDSGQTNTLALIQHHIVKAIILFVAGLVAGFLTLELKRQILDSFRTLQERNNIANIFGQHVSPAVVEKLLHQPTEMNTESRHVCVMFLDIRDFTRFSETHQPEEVVNFLNTLFEPMIEIVNQHNGVINKFLGDGFMAIFGAPLSDGKDSQNAVNAAQAILHNVKQKIAEEKLPPIRIGIGLHTGQAVTGTVGSTQRKEYTVIGDVVNLASRIEQLNKQLGSQLLISEAVLEAMGKNINPIIDQGLVPIKGRNAPVQIYQID
ncbi:MAG TPA: adenylate/guanylate cyclase domain-containing protein [Thiotrichaceae bacterium]|nr:adenylate/guanylate cyclase domain-containing protein [Thiotrichaceae bacterium]